MPGRPYIEGGVSDEERLSLQARRGDFALWVVTAARGSGAYLADVRVTVTDEYSHVVWDKPVDGPWLLIDLPPGRYVVEARFEGQAQRRVTRIMPGDHHKLFFHFEADVDRSPGAPPRAQRVGRAGR